jgi:hypothetical protein
MAEDTKDEGVVDPIKPLLEESLVQQRHEIMNNFSQIIRRLLAIADTSTSRIHFGGAPPFMVQVNF